ncbi:uncharacterized protein CTHT_0022240 [Thermochaetoides thermophila DSM 1495]|uniref:Uncharacterized protein n=1 Tax=Chaetomium thermophilum (strain DSM 1495 / CBS 144.50 / IMI 039719) TaxID=759272 RepID=G0S419_CHATD|nr:hypothetical protein CTHT_0022240 [Thermochaetoides thermophila DSM 1495]EGS20395.1 hypothetical protein CTHT_0022240 [Thermochaetoides thermophila DSM 1495]
MLDLIQKIDAPVEDSIIVAWSSRETAEPDAPGDLTSTAPSETTRAVEVTEHRGEDEGVAVAKGELLKMSQQRLKRSWNAHRPAGTDIQLNPFSRGSPDNASPAGSRRPQDMVIPWSTTSRASQSELLGQAFDAATGQPIPMLRPPPHPLLRARAQPYRDGELGIDSSESVFELEIQIP